MIKISETVRASHAPDGAVLLDIEQGKIYSLNPVASRILCLVAQGLDEGQIQSEISREFSQNLETIRDDVTVFLAALRRHRLITGEGKPTANGGL